MVLPSPPLPLQARVLRRARRRLRMHEQHHAQLLRLRPERIELPIRQLLAFDAAADGGAAQSQLPDRLVQLLGRQVGVLQRDASPCRRIDPGACAHHCAIFSFCSATSRAPARGRPNSPRR